MVLSWHHLHGFCSGRRGYFYLQYGHPPVAANDSAFFYEAENVHIPLSAPDRPRNKEASIPRQRKMHSNTVLRSTKRIALFVTAFPVKIRFMELRCVPLRCSSGESIRKVILSAFPTTPLERPTGR
jgi:hypothetical protein